MPIRALRASEARSEPDLTDTPDTPTDDHARRLDALIEKLPKDWLRRWVRWLLGPSAKLVRIPAGLLLIAGGLLSFLPILGLWMLPLGIILLAQDVPPLRWLVDRGMDWIERRWPRVFETDSERNASP